MACFVPTHGMEEELINVQREGASADPQAPWKPHLTTRNRVGLRKHLGGKTRGGGRKEGPKDSVCFFRAQAPGTWISLKCRAPGVLAQQSVPSRAGSGESACSTPTPGQRLWVQARLPA